MCILGGGDWDLMLVYEGSVSRSFGMGWMRFMRYAFMRDVGLYV